MKAEYGLLIDYEYCSGCQSCEVTCKEEHNYPVGKWGIKVLEEGPWEIEDGSGVFNYNYIPVPTDLCDLCAERVAALNMYLQSRQTVVRRLIAFRDRPPYGGGSGMPCGACREFFMQLSEKNKDMEIMVNFDTHETVRLHELMPNWWGAERYEKKTET